MHSTAKKRRLSLLLLGLSVTVFWPMLISALDLSERHKIKDDRITFPVDVARKPMDWELQVVDTQPNINKTKQEEHLREKISLPKINETETKTELNNTRKNDTNPMDLGPRIALDSLPKCVEGFKLIGTRCRKEA